MPLRQRVVSHPETLQEQELAAQEKYLEGLELLADGYPDGAVYLLGYVAEMLLKNAYFLFTGARPADPIGPRLGPARRAARRFNRLQAVSHEHYHSIRFWTFLLIETRRFAGRLLPHDIEARLCQRARRLYQNWIVEMRYRQGLARQREAQTVFEDVTWLLENYTLLWR